MKFLTPTWHAPKNVNAFSTLRQGGVSQAPYDSFNLATHVGDMTERVLVNRALLVEALALPQMPVFLNQTHSTQVITLPCADALTQNADASYSAQSGQVCLVMTADCLPVLFCNQAGNEIAAAHAGWRGLCNGILEETVAKFKCSPSEILVWLAPAISVKAFQVGAEVRQQFIDKDPKSAVAFIPDPTTTNKYFADLYQIARLRLNVLGIQAIYGGEFCTYSEPEHFFSYRRDGETGRMASLIWLD